MRPHPRLLRLATSATVDAESSGIVEDDLLLRCRSGETEAWKEIHETYFTFVYRIAKRLGTPSAELEDVCQDVFIVAFRKLASFKQGRLTTWLYRITANIVSDRHQRRRVRRALQALFVRGDEPASPSRTPDREVESREAEMLVAQILERMAPKKREVFVLYEIEGLSGERIAELVGCKLETVWTRLHYARKDFERIARKRVGPRA